ncbi:MAG: hypothetical protein HY858_12040 [Candidatus Solibacter usitatus]|nr:hypothetical protein [Candidatus Solibacter usitatus]
MTTKLGFIPRWVIAGMVGVLAAQAGQHTKAVVKPEVLNRLLERLGPNAAIKDYYVGTEACLGCHQDKQEFRSSLHYTGLKTAIDDRFSMQTQWGVIADYDNNGVDDFKQGLDFNKIKSAFDQFKPNAPVLGYKAGKGYVVTIAGVEYLAGFIHGGSGSYKQRFVLRFPVTDRASGWSADYYYSPVQFNEVSRSYVKYSDNYWYNADNTPKITSLPTAKQAATLGKSFNKDCVGCHSTQFGVSQDSNGEWVSSVPTPVYTPPDSPHWLDLDGNGWGEAYNIGCERCHGPGVRHIINLGDPYKLLNPARDFTAKQQNELCGSCHSRGTSADGKHEYPMSLSGEDYGRNLGASLFDGFMIAKPGLWPDGKTSKQHHQQLQDLMKSAKWEFQFHKVTCSDCHDVHGATRKHIKKVLEVDGAGGAKLKINVKVEDNTLCLACHAGFGPFVGLKREDIAMAGANSAMIAKVVEDHTKHLYDPDGKMGLSRCTECHMARMAASGDPYDMASHTFEVVAPEKTLKYQAQGGMPNSCAVRCHRPLAPLFGLPADPSLVTWNESSDVELSNWLAKYYGPNGSWWKTAQ